MSRSGQRTSLTADARDLLRKKPARVARIKRERVGRADERTSERANDEAPSPSRPPEKDTTLPLRRRQRARRGEGERERERRSPSESRQNERANKWRRKRGRARERDTDELAASDKRRARETEAQRLAVCAPTDESLTHMKRARAPASGRSIDRRRGMCRRGH